MATTRRHIPTIADARRLFEQGHITAARELTAGILQAHPHSVDAMVLMAILARQQHRLVEVARWTAAALQVKPRDRYVRILQAQNFLAMADAASAIQAAEEALEIFPGDPDLVLLKGIAHEARYEYEQALACANILLKDPAPRAEVYLVAGSALHGLGRYQQAIDCMRLAANDPRHPARERRRLWFLLFKTYDRIREYGQAMHACAQAHALEDRHFNPAKFVAFTDSLVTTYSAAAIQRLSRSQLQSDIPVFVVGMPRSGTTLVEQILHAHPQAFGAGELPDIFGIAKSLTLETGSMYVYPDAAADLTPEIATRLGRKYLDRLRQMGGSAVRVVNKMPHDYQHLGLIWQLLPGTRIIHVLRDPMDVCLSCYTRQLSLDAIPYVGDLEHLAIVYRQHERLMNHWRDTLDLPILVIQYEDLVRDQEGVSRRMIDFLGLPWDDQCLRYWEAKRTVRTLSYDQVNKPIYDSSIGRWRNYAEYLEPLAQALDLHKTI